MPNVALKINDDKEYKYKRYLDTYDYNVLLTNKFSDWENNSLEFFR